MTFNWLCSVILQIGQLVEAQREAADIFSVAAGVFALILFSLSMYAWSRRRQPMLIIVASAFLLYFLKQVIELLAEIYGYDPGWLLLVFMDFVILALFFIAIVVKPRRRQAFPTDAI
jgi:hypothetical protein